MQSDPYTVTVALDGDTRAVGQLYVDDGRSFAYRRHSSSVTTLTVAPTSAPASASSPSFTLTFTSKQSDVDVQRIIDINADNDDIVQVSSSSPISHHHTLAEAHAAHTLFARAYTVTVERVVVIGVIGSVRSVTAVVVVDDDDDDVTTSTSTSTSTTTTTTTQLTFTQDVNTNTVTVRKPAVRMTAEWTLQFEMA
jgi:hypothetical protein